MILQHRPGLKHVNADALSRSESGLPCSDFRTDIAVTELPCHGCKFCRKAHADWYKFSQEVDNVENLSSAAPLFFTGVHICLEYEFRIKCDTNQLGDAYHREDL